MKRIILYLLAITLLPQIASAAVLVGKTEGAFSVSPTGAATYTIPIKVQNGLSDFSPSISLTYSSQAGNGIAGMGFSISGLSAISIVPRSVYFDGHAEAIYTGEDNAFALDGQRLLLIEGPNGQTGATYRTENEQYNLISITGSQNGTPATFQVKATNGTTYKYGNSSGRFTLSNGEAYQWALDYAEDVLGNYIQYNYSQEGVLYPTSITYGRNTHGSAGVDCTVSFTYESRPDSIPVYMFGEQRFLKKRLKSIVCKYSGNIYRTYTLNYTEDVFSHLVSVTETGTSSASVPSTTFEWEVPSEFQLDCSSRDIEGSDDDEDDDDDKVDYYYFSSDLDGDGFSEMIKVKKETFSNYDTRTGFYVNKWVPGTQSYAWVNSYFLNTGFFDALYGTYAIRAYKKKGNSLILPCCTIYPNDYLRSQMCFIFPEKNWVFNVPLKSRPTEKKMIPAYMFVDSDGDGVDNIFVIEKEKKNNKYPAYLATIDFSENTISTTPLNLNLNGVPDKIRCADFNADGMPDLLITTYNTLYIYFNKAGTFSDEDKFWCYNPNFKGFDVIETGDFNGDGLMDLIVDVEEVHWMVAMNSGNVKGNLFHWDGIRGLFVNGAYESTGRRDDLFCIVQDIDGDGKSDAIVGRPHKEEGGSVHVLKFNGDSFDIVSGYGMRDSNEFPNRSHIIQGDFEGKGRAQILYKGKGLGQETTGWNLLQNTTMIPSTQKIISVTDGLGAKDSISYGLLTDKDVYQVNDNSTLPQSVIYLAGGLPVVKTWTEVIPTDSRTTDYSYANGLVHLQGKGFLGFKDIRTESSAGVVSETHNELNSTYKVLLPQRVIQSNTCGDTLSQKTISTTLDYVTTRSYNTKETYSISNKPFDDFTEREESKEFINGFPRFQGSYNDLTQTETYTTFWKSPRQGVYIKGLPEEIQIGKGNLTFDTEDDLILDNILYERDPATGLVLKETRKRIYYEEDIISTDGYSYNEYGQVTQHYTVAYNSTDTLVTRYEYNDKGQLSKEYNPKGLCRSYTYNSSNGTLTLVRDFDGVTTRYIYDGFHRETKRYTNVETCQTTRALSNYGGGVYSIKETVTGKTPVTTYYDAWERKIAESAPLANGTVMYTDYHYLPNGQLGFVSFPHKKNEPSSEGTTYTYDASFRKISEVDSNGKTSTWSYSPKQVTSCIDGVTTTTSYYTEDKISEVEDAIGSVKYDYNADLNISSIESAAGTAQYQYDTVGRLVQTTDMNGVVKQYKYDVNGNPFRTTIGGSYVETNYDKYGILRSKTWSDPNVPSHTVTYTYDSKYRLTREQGEGYYYTYSYDQYGRLTHKHNGIGNDQLEYIDVDIQYSSGSLISNTVSYFGSIPTCITEQYSYQNGYRISDVLNDTLVWELTNQDKWGHPKGEGDFIGTTSHSFDDYGNMLSMSRLGRFSISESYTYNIQTGNMSAKNNTHFSYDNMNRLIGWENYSYTYDNKGNITSQPIVGNLSYDGFRVTDMSASSGYFPDDSLRISYYKAIERPMSIENEHYKADLYYDGAGDRYMMKVYVKEHGRYNLLFTRFYLDANAEVTVDSLGHTSHLYYAGGDSYTSPAVMVIDENEFSNIYHISRDNIGSAIHYENSDGVCYQNSYSPWGVRTYIGESTAFYQPGEEPGYGPFYRTYTGHEDLWMFGLINANARLYSPYLGRFVSPDPLLNSEGGPLDYNPYIYARNNPYKYIDRNGEFPWLLFGAALGAGFNIWQNSDNIHCFGDALFYGFAGAGAGSLGGWIGPSATVSLGLAATGGIPGVVSGAITGYISSTVCGTLNAAYSGDFSKFSLGSIFTQTAFSAAIGGIMGGIDAVRKNTNFFTGGIKEELFGACYCSTCNSSGFSLGESTITGTYVGTVDGVPVFETKKFGSVIKKQADGYYHFRGITIPKRGIIVAQGAYSSGKDIGTALVQHEFGHILQCRMYGSYAYYHIIAPESLANCIYSNAKGNQAIHDNFWTETWANYLSKEFFGSNYVGGPNYPAINISSWNRFRMEVARTSGVISGWRGLLQW